MKKYYKFVVLATLFALVTIQVFSQGIAINTDNSDPDPSSMLDVKSTTKGLLVPRMSSAQRLAIASPAVGLMVFDLTTESFWFKSTSGWINLSNPAASSWSLNGSNLYYNGGNVGIGDDTPAASFTVGNGDKFQVSGAEGDLTFTDDNASITFPPTTTPNSPMIYMFASGTSNDARMVLAHSPLFNDFGLQYQDASDEFHILGGGLRTITLSTSGYLGILQENPTYNLDVNGTTRITGTTVLNGSTTLNNNLTANNNVTVGGTTIINGTTTLNNSLTVNNSVTVGGTISVNSNKGLVRSNNSTQQKIVRTAASFGVTNLASNSFIDSGLLTYETFGAIPTVTVGQVSSATGEWYKVMVIPINVTASSCQFRIFNAASDAATLTGSWSVLIVGQE